MGLITASIRALTNARALDVAINDANGDQLSGFNPSKPSAAALTQVPASATSVSLLASNAARRKFIIVNDGNKELYIAFGATATTAAYSVLLGGGGVYESDLDDYTGAVSGIWSSASGNAVITELT